MLYMHALASGPASVLVAAPRSLPLARCTTGVLQHHASQPKETLALTSQGCPAPVQDIRGYCLACRPRLSRRQKFLQSAQVITCLFVNNLQAWSSLTIKHSQKLGFGTLVLP